MKIMLLCSKAFYVKLQNVKNKLEAMGHIITMPNCWDAPQTESKYRGTPMHSEWKAKMYRQSREKLNGVDAVLVLNYEKNGVKNYIGGATFLEVYDAFNLGKKIFFINDLPDGILRDELIGFSPIVIYEDLTKII